MENIELLKSTIKGLSLRYGSLRRINTLLTEAGSSYEFMDGVLALIIDMFSAEAGAIILSDGSEKMKIEVFRAQLPNEEEKKAKEKIEGIVFKSSETPIEEIIGGGFKTVVTEKQKLSSSYRKTAGKHLGGIKNTAAATIRTKDAAVGLIELYNFPVFSDEKKESFASVGGQVGVTLEIYRRLEGLRSRAKVMREITSITEAISEPRHLDSVLDMIIENMLEFFKAEGCSIFLKDSEDNIEFAAVSGEKKDVLAGQKINPGEGVIGWSVAKDEPVIVRNAKTDERFSPRVDKATGMKTGSIICAPLKVLNEVTGAIEAVRGDPSFPFNEEDLGLLIIIASHASLAIDKARMYTMKDRWLKSVVELLTRAVDSKDTRYPGHSVKVRKYTSFMAVELNLDQEEMHCLDIAAAVKDVGKLSTPDSIMEKKEKLSEDEGKKLRQYPVKSVEILETMQDFDSVIPIIKYHCENYDGTGYPHKLKGEEIPRLSRILSVADAFAAMTSDRSYRKALSISKAKEEIENQKGKEFDPEAVDALLRSLDKQKPED